MILTFHASCVLGPVFAQRGAAMMSVVSVVAEETVAEASVIHSSWMRMAGASLPRVNSRISCARSVRDLVFWPSESRPTSVCVCVCVCHDIQTFNTKRHGRSQEETNEGREYRGAALGGSALTNRY